MPAPVILRNAQDSYVDQNTPKKNYNSSGQMFLQDGAFGYLFFSRPFPIGARIISAKLRVWTGMAYSGSITLNVARINEKWFANRVTFENRPGVGGGGGAVSITKNGPGARTLWETDVTVMMQAISDGAQWFGFRVDFTGSARKWIHSAQSNVPKLRPQLEIEWSDEPDAPSDLAPTDEAAVSTQKPVLRFNFSDVSGDTSMRGYQVQVSTVPTFSSTELDTGTVLSDTPQCALAGTSYAGLPTDGSIRYWRVRVQDGAGIWSEWSLAASMRYAVKYALDINSPSAASPTVTDSTPPIVWTFGNGSVQVKYRLRLLDAETNEQLWNSGEVTSTTNSHTLPKNLLRVVGKQYKLELRVWDGFNRQSTPGDPVYTQVERVFTYANGTAQPVTAIRVIKDGNWPWRIIEVETSTAPDSFKLFRNDELILDSITPGDVVFGTGVYRIIDRKIPGRASHTWSVARVVNGTQSSNNPTATETVRNETPWLMELDGTNAIPLVNADMGGLEHVEDSEVMYPQGAPPILVINSQWGAAGPVVGELAGNHSSLTSKQMLNRYLNLKRKSGRRMVLVWADRAIECFIHQATHSSIPLAGGGTDYEVNFDVVELDYTVD